MDTRTINLARTARALGFDPAALPPAVASKPARNRWRAIRTGAARFGKAPTRAPRGLARGLARTVA